MANPYEGPATGPPRGSSNIGWIIAAVLGGLLVVPVGLGLLVGRARIQGSTARDDCSSSSIALNRATASHDLATTRRLLDKGADPTRRDQRGSDALACAINVGDHGMNAIADQRTVPPSESAGDAVIVRLLLAHHAKPDGRPGARPAVEALRVKDLAVVDVLLPVIDLDLPYATTRVRVKDALLTLASSNGDTSIVRSLLAKGADPDRAPYLSPLLRATLYRNHEVMALLLAHGADPDAGQVDSLALILVTGKLVPTLRDRVDAEVNAARAGGPATPGPVPTMAATGEPFDDLSGVPLGGPVVGASPLGVATAVNDLVAVQVLLAGGAAPDHLGFGRLTPLHLAAVACEPDVATALVRHGAKVTAADRAAACPAVAAALPH